jgi:hypothetical protein
MNQALQEVRPHFNDEEPVNLTLEGLLRWTWQPRLAVLPFCLAARFPWERAVRRKTFANSLGAVAIGKAFPGTTRGRSRAPQSDQIRSRHHPHRVSFPKRGSWRGMTSTTRSAPRAV